MQKLISSGLLAMEKIKEGVDLVADPVRRTISPNGRTVIISESYVADYDTRHRPVLVTKDGYNTAMKISSTDAEIQVGVMFAQQAAEKQMIDAGDATSTCCLFTKSLLGKGIKELNEGKSHIQITNSIRLGIKQIVEQIEQMAIPVNGDIEIIRKVATTSANNDKEIGDMIASAYEKIGDDGVIKIERSKSINTSIKITGGMTFGKGWASQFFINSPKEECVLQNPYILIVDEHLVQLKDILPLLEKINRNNGAIGKKRPLMVFCNRSDGDALAALIINHQNGTIPACVVQMDFLGEKKIEFMKDISVATSGFYISENTGGKLEEIGIEDLGESESVVVSRNETTIIGGKKNDKEFDKLISNLKQLESTEDDTEQKDLLRKRIARLNSSVAVLSVGGVTEVEMEERLDRVDDAVRAVKCAIEEGYVAGGGTALARCEKTGYDTVDSLLLLPLYQICENSAVDFNEICNKLPFENNRIGYNAKMNVVEDLVESGIIEPVKSNRCALQNAASVVCQILNSYYMVTDTL